MVKNSDLSYGDIVTKAMNMTDSQEVGETMEAVRDQFAKILCEAIEGNRAKGITGKYYIWVRVQKDAYAANALHLYPMCRRTRPSPYETEDHYLWSYDSNGSQLKFEWCIPRKEQTAFILANPYKFDEDYVRMLKTYQKGKLDEEFLIEEIKKQEREKTIQFMFPGSKEAKKSSIIKDLVFS